MTSIERPQPNEDEQAAVDELFLRICSGELTLRQAFQEASRYGSRFVSLAVRELVRRYRLTTEDTRDLRRARINHLLMHGDDETAVKAVAMSQREEELERRRTGSVTLSTAVVELLTSDVRPQLPNAPEPESEGVE